MEVYGLLASGYGDWPIIKQIAWLLGQVMNGIFNVLSAIGIENIGVCIIIFTIIVYTLMIPLTIKQQKFSKMSAVMQPEIKKIQKKYEGKKDQASMMKQQMFCCMRSWMHCWEQRHWEISESISQI